MATLYDELKNARQSLDEFKRTLWADLNLDKFYTWLLNSHHMHKFVNFLLWPLGCHISKVVSLTREITEVDLIEASASYDPRTKNIGLGFNIKNYLDVRTVSTYFVIWRRWTFLVKTDIWKGILPPTHFNCRCVGG